MDYLEFEVRIGDASGQMFPVAVVRSPAGEASAITSVPLDDTSFLMQLQTLEALFGGAQAPGMPRMQAGPASQQAPLTFNETSVEHLGRQLFDILLPTELRSCYRSSLTLARAQGKGLRLRLRTDNPRVAALPWEFLYDDADGDFVCLNSETPLTRYLEIPRPTQPLTTPPPLHILGMVASPRDLPPVDVTRQKEELAGAIDHLLDAGSVTLTWLKGESWRDLQAAMRSGPWHVFHFVGHGRFDERTGEGQLALTSEDGGLHILTAIQLARLFSGHQSLRLAVISACEGARASKASLFSSVGSALTRHGIPAVTSMQFEISEQAALEFSRMLYDTLADGLPVDAAVAEARKAMNLASRHSVEWGTPVLHMHAPDGLLFSIDIATAIFPAGAASQASNERQPQVLAAAAPAVTQIKDDVRRGLLVLLRKVKQFWVEGVLEQSLHRAALIDLGMELMTGAVHNPWGTVLERPNAASQPLAPRQTICDVFEEQGRSLLILGEPGSGKTTSLLGLARDLIQRAEHEPGQPIPTKLVA